MTTTPPRLSRARPGLLALCMSLNACTGTNATRTDGSTTTKPSIQDEDTPSSLKADIDSLATRALADGPIAGITVAVSRGGNVLHSNGYGYADLENDVQATPLTVYRIGSVTKQFTAVAIMQLVESGRLALDAPLTDVLPSYPMHGKTITVRQLLGHTSGIKSYTEVEDWRESDMLDKSTTEMLALFKDLPLESEPGEAFSYSNSGYFLLGVIIEKLASVPYATYLAEHVLKPASLADTQYCSENTIVKHRAQGYRRVASKFRNDAPLSMTQPYAAGALCSTAGDLNRWRAALLDGTLLTSESLKRMESSGSLNDGRNSGYGFGVFLGELGEHPMVSHGGGINGFASHTSYYPDDDVAISILSNTEGANVSALEKQIARLVLDVPEPTVEDLPLPAKSIASYVGTYVLEGLGELKVTAKGEKLYSQLSSQPELRLLYQGTHEFVPDLTPLGVEPDPNIRLRFAFTESKVARSVTVKQGGMNVELLRSE